MVIIFYPATSKSEIFFKKYSVHMHPRLEAILLPLVPMTLSVTCRTPTVPTQYENPTKTYTAAGAHDMTADIAKP